MADFIMGRKLIDELIKVGIADELTNRVIIDVPANSIPTVYIQKIGSKRLLDIAPFLVGGEIRGVPMEAEEDPDDTVDH